MKSDLDGFCHRKSGSPAKHKRFLSSLSVCLCPFTRKMQRSNKLRFPDPNECMDGMRSRVSNDRMSMDFAAANSAVHTHTCSHTTALRPPFGSGSAEGSERAPNAWPCIHQVNSHLTHCMSQTSSPEAWSWNLASPPEPSRVASAETTFYAPQGSFPVQARYKPSQVPRNIKLPTMTLYHQVIGDPSLKIFRVRLPPHLLHLLDDIVLGCEAHAATLPKGWLTGLYSLTKQDIALRRIPHLYVASKPITVYIKRSMMALLGVQSIKMDRNQPHVLKYSIEDGHTGVELHHDKCDLTANLCLSRSRSYVGGGYVRLKVFTSSIWSFSHHTPCSRSTFFPTAREVVRLEFGEFLIHPGSLVHAGMNILHGTRHLMIFFANVK